MATQRFADRVQGNEPEQSRWERLATVAFDRRWRHLAAILGVIALALGARALLLKSPLFALKYLEVSEAEHVTRAELKRFLDVYPGQSIAAIDVDQVRARLTDHPWVAEARVRREWPNGLSIELMERRPVAVILISDDGADRPDGRVKSHKNLYYVDAEGVVFNQVPVWEERRFPVITGFTRRDFLESDRSRPVQRVTEAVELLRQARLDWDEDMPPIQEVSYDGPAGFALLVDRTRVLVGQAPFDDVFFRLETILRHLGARFANVSRIDLTRPDRAVVKGLREEKST